MTRHGKVTKIIITPKFYPKGWRILRPREDVEKGDYYWSKINKCWTPAGKGKVGFLASKPLTYVRRESQIKIKEADWSITHSDRRQICELATDRAYGHAYGIYFLVMGWYQVGSDTFFLDRVGDEWEISYWGNYHVPGVIGVFNTKGTVTSRGTNVKKV